MLNEEAPDGGYVRTPEEWRWIPGALKGIATLTRWDSHVPGDEPVGARAQGMASGDLEAIHNQMLDAALNAGGAISALSCARMRRRRVAGAEKPLLVESATEASGKPSVTLLVGDDLPDLEATRAAGIGAVLVLSSKGRQAAKLTDSGIPETAMQEPK